ncbi:hypothetical protein M3J09_010761 [Ascochyta lentis]
MCTVSTDSSLAAGTCDPTEERTHQLTRTNYWQHFDMLLLLLCTNDKTRLSLNDARSTTTVHRKWTPHTRRPLGNSAPPCLANSTPS